MKTKRILPFFLIPVLLLASLFVACQAAPATPTFPLPTYEPPVPLVFSPEVLPEAQAGQTYSTTITISGNKTPVGDASITSGELPLGLTLHHEDGERFIEISGIPQQSGDFQFTLYVWCYGTMVTGQTGQQIYDLQVKNTETATPKPSPTTPPTTTLKPTTPPTATLKPTVVPTATQLVSFPLPAWASDPDGNVILVATGNYKDGFRELILVNASDGERLALPPFDIGGYFWTEDGKQIGLLLKDKENVILINTLDGQISRTTVDEQATRFVFDSGNFPIALFASGNDLNSPDFTLYPDWWREDMSFDQRYLLKDSGDNTNVLDLETEELFQPTDSDDDFYDYAAAWSPNQLYLAVAQGDEPTGLGFGYFETNAHLLLKIYDFSRAGELVNVYENISFPNWSPDGAKFLYQPLLQTEDGLFQYAAPCVYDLLADTTHCYHEAFIRHQPENGTVELTSLQWLPDQTAISYVYTIIASDPYRESGGLCLLNLADGSERCILEKFEEPEQKIIRYHLSPDGKAVNFRYDASCPGCNYTTNPQLAIADTNTGSYVVVGDMYDDYSYGGESYGLWRPIPLTSNR